MNNSLGPVIKRRRHEMNMSQKELAVKVHVSPSAICQIENRGTVNPKLDLIAQILYELKTPPSWAFQQAGLPAYADNPITAPALIELREIVTTLPPGPKRRKIVALLLETARALVGYASDDTVALTIA
jgi:transcriptional regulator with XRE-family HTH domain